MPELARRIASKLRHLIGDRRYAKRIDTRLPIIVGLASNGMNSNGFRLQASLIGHTLDISTTGLALIIPAIRIGEHYLAGGDRRLWLKVELPDGLVDMHVAPVRYESMDQHETEKAYLVGVRITEVSEEHRALFNDHLEELLRGSANH